MKTLFTLLFAACLFAGVAVAETPSDLDVLKKTFGSSRSSIEKKQAERKKALMKGYRDMLESTMKRRGQEADLDAYLVIKTELDRYDKEHTIPMFGDGDVSLAISAYLKSVERIDVDTLKQTLNLIQRYKPHLDSLLRNSMRAGDIDQAKMVQVEVDRIAFILHEAESRVPQATTPEKTAPKGPDAKEHRITIMSSSLAKGGWKPTTVFVPEGARVSITAAPMATLSPARYTVKAFHVRVGLAGNEFMFDTKGQYTYMTGQRRRRKRVFHRNLEFTAQVEGKLFTVVLQKARFKLVVKVTPPDS